jgi:hypothetical protein
MSGITKHFDATVEYFSVKQLADGGENPWAKAEDATHYVMVIEKCTSRRGSAAPVYIWRIAIGERPRSG